MESLKKNFRTQGILRLEPKHHILAVIDEQDLDRAVKSSGTTHQALLKSPQKKPPELIFPSDYRLKCLYGQYRIQAARETLPPQDKWWTVDIYLKGMSPELETILIEEYSKSINFSDSHIYRKIREYKSSGDMFAEKRCKPKDLKQFLKHATFPSAFDTLLVIPSLWDELKIGVLHKIIAMKCDEEILHYIGHIRSVWSTILGESRELMDLTDRATVKALQLRAPKQSPEDFKILQRLLDNGELFSATKNREHQQTILRNLRKVEWLIPSIYMLFEDVKYLKPPMKIMKRLPGGPFKGTVRQTIEQMFSGVNQMEDRFVLQNGDSDFRSIPGNLTDQVEFGYRQLWLYSMRHFTEMIEECPRKEDHQPTPVPMEPDEAVWCKFAALAYRLGFESEEIHRLMSKDPDRELARSTLLKARRPHRFQYPEAVFESFIDQIVEMFAAADEISCKRDKPPLLVDGPGEVLPRRCGRTFENAYEYDKEFLFMQELYDPLSSEGKNITSFFVRVSVYFAFFGRRIPEDSPPPRRRTVGEAAENETSMQSSDPSPNFQQPQSNQERTEPSQWVQVPAPTGLLTTAPMSSSPQMVHAPVDNMMEMLMDWSPEFLPYKNEQMEIWQKGNYVKGGYLPCNPIVVKDVMNQAAKKGFQVADQDGRNLLPEHCYRAVGADEGDGSYILFLRPRKKVGVDRQLISASKSSVQKPSQTVAKRKIPRVQEISQLG
ncbi:MAG: hypothetical protein M1840_006984 [Geoglossum simile]|nr:MAG: hypothetical protein M1840_006984 [Geoglossum simile]